MAEAISPAVASEAVRETLFGRRGIVKAVHACLPLGVAASLGPTPYRGHLVTASLLALLVAGCWAQAAILANDLTDSAEDAAAGKRRWIRALPRGAGWAVVALVVAIGAVATGAASWRVLIVYAAAVALGLLYSLRPVRLKDRGPAGPLAYAAASALAYAVLPCAWLGAPVLVLAALAPAVLLDKWVNLQFHQVIDYEADRASGGRTHAVAIGPDRARGLLKWGSWLTVLWLAGVAAFVAVSLPTSRAGAAGVVGLVVLLAGRYAHGARERGDGASALVRELPPLYLALTLALFRALPLLLFARLTVAEPSAWGPLAAAVFLVGLDAWFAVGYRYE
jgi:4-hydroxybenzoate polyprenyltransferase